MRFTTKSESGPDAFKRRPAVMDLVASPTARHGRPQVGMRHTRLWTHFLAGAIVCVIGAIIRLDPATLIVMGG